MSKKKVCGERRERGENEETEKRVIEERKKEDRVRREREWRRREWREIEERKGKRTATKQAPFKWKSLKLTAFHLIWVILISTSKNVWKNLSSMTQIKGKYFQEKCTFYCSTVGGERVTEIERALWCPLLVKHLFSFPHCAQWSSCVSWKPSQESSLGYFLITITFNLTSVSVRTVFFPVFLEVLWACYNPACCLYVWHVYFSPKTETGVLASIILQSLEMLGRQWWGVTRYKVQVQVQKYTFQVLLLYLCVFYWWIFLLRYF